VLSNSFGHDRVVLGPVIGAFGEMSDNTKHIADAIAAELANANCSYYSLLGGQKPGRCGPTFASSCIGSGA
jgi:hypothetical protein